MGTGIVFVYLLIAALVAPVAWGLWWGFASIGGHPRVTRARRQTPAMRAAPHPVPIDLALPVRRNAITVYRASGAEITTCEGPDGGGRCSRPLSDGTVPCAGCLVALPRPLRGSLEWQIPSGYQACLVGSYAAFRRPA